MQPIGKEVSVGTNGSPVLAKRLCEASVRKAWDVYSAFDWPEALTGFEWMISPELISIYGTPLYDKLTDEQRKRLSLFEIGNFFSLVLQGERPLVQGLVHRLYDRHTDTDVSDYLHHFVDEENKHMVMFGMFCRRYLGKVYPEKKMAVATKLSRGEEDVIFFCKVLVVEELGDFYNVAMQKDDRLHPIVRELNRVHHIDESRHLAFGRMYLKELFQQHAAKWSTETRARTSAWVSSYLESSWADYYNPTMYKDAGLPDAYEIHRHAMASEICAEHRRQASQKLVDLFLEIGLLEKPPEYKWTI